MNNNIPKKNNEVSELKKKLDNLSMKQIKIDISSSSQNKQGLKKGKVEVEQLIKERIIGKEKKQEKSRAEDLKITDFIIQATLGTGTFGRVRQVMWKKKPDTAEVLALKMLKKTEIVRLNQVEHIKNEKNILLETNHPFIVEMKNCFQDEKYVYMLLEYVSGGELFSRLRKDGRFSNDVSLFYATQIILAIHYLHQRNILY